MLEPKTEDFSEQLSAIAEELRHQSDRKKYTWLPNRILDDIVGAAYEEDILKQLLLNLLGGFSLSQSPIALPESVQTLYERELDRIHALTRPANKVKLGFESDVIQKDIAILTFRLIPVGAEFAEPWCPIWKRQALTSRISQFPRAAFFFVIKRNGFWPYFQLHMHQDSHQDFNQRGWHSTYMRLAELLQSNPSHKGWFSSSWFLDPALEQISPHLSYLRTVPERNGGAVFFMEDDPTGSTGALATSRTRRNMFESGQYRPRIYMRVWPRSKAIKWLTDLQNDIADNRP